MSFTKTSHSPSISPFFTLSAYCLPRSHSSHQPSTLDLNAHLGNHNGHFIWGATNISASARNPILKGAVLCAELKTRDGKWRGDQIDLDRWVGNKDGCLVAGGPGSPMVSRRNTSESRPGTARGEEEDGGVGLGLGKAPAFDPIKLLGRRRTNESMISRPSLASAMLQEVVAMPERGEMQSPQPELRTRASLISILDPRAAEVPERSMFQSPPPPPTAAEPASLEALVAPTNAEAPLSTSPIPNSTTTTAAPEPVQIAADTTPLPAPIVLDSLPSIADILEESVADLRLYRSSATCTSPLLEPAKAQVCEAATSPIARALTREDATSPIPELSLREKVAVRDAVTSPMAQAPTREDACSPIPELSLKEKVAVRDAVTSPMPEAARPTRSDATSPIPEILGMTMFERLVDIQPEPMPEQVSESSEQEFVILPNLTVETADVSPPLPPKIPLEPSPREANICKKMDSPLRLLSPRPIEPTSAASEPSDLFEEEDGLSSSSDEAPPLPPRSNATTRPASPAPSPSHADDDDPPIFLPQTHEIPTDPTSTQTRSPFFNFQFLFTGASLKTEAHAGPLKAEFHAGVFPPKVGVEILGKQFGWEWKGRVPEVRVGYTSRF